MLSGDPQHLIECLAQERCSINACQMRGGGRQGGEEGEEERKGGGRGGRRAAGLQRHRNEQVTAVHPASEGLSAALGCAGLHHRLHHKL